MELLKPAVLKPLESCPSCGARRIGISDGRIYFVCNAISEAGLLKRPCNPGRQRYYINETKGLVSDKLMDPVAPAYEGWIEVQKPAFEAFKRMRGIQ